MNQTSRELVYRTLNFDTPERAPRILWLLPWATAHYPDEVERILNDFPPDISALNPHYKEVPRTSGDLFKAGTYIDEWGCTLENLQDGIQGEVKDPLIKDWQEDAAKVRFPRELLTIDTDAINRQYDESNLFILSSYQPNPFERLQFLRGTENLYMDLLDPPDAMLRFLKELHNFYCELVELWSTQTRVDGIFFLDDWGAQQQMLIKPDLWRELFKPIYRDYIDIAHSNNKKTFMHSDGYILPLFKEFIELGLDAINSQIFCMGVESLKPYAGKITFWGEIDRQQILPHGTTEDIEAAVKSVYENLWKDGGCIAQCEFGPGAKPENVYQVFASWNTYTLKKQEDEAEK